MRLHTSGSSEAGVMTSVRTIAASSVGVDLVVAGGSHRRARTNRIAPELPPRRLLRIDPRPKEQCCLVHIRASSERHALQYRYHRDVKRGNKCARRALPVGGGSPANNCLPRRALQALHMKLVSHPAQVVHPQPGRRRGGCDWASTGRLRLGRFAANRPWGTRCG